jgi:4-hydroxy-2-oxoheptanedioate aldolase
MSAQLREKIRSGAAVYGTCITATAPLWPSIVERAGLDFVFIDTEHIVLDSKELSVACFGYRALGIVPIVRIPSPDPYRVCQVIDGGAWGVVAPYLETEFQVRELVGAVKYRPLKGERLQRILHDGEKPDSGLQAYLDKYNKNNLCIANIESVPALERLETLLGIEGLDAVFIGPHDLSISMNLPKEYDHPDFVAAVQRIIRVSRERGLGVGIHFSLEPERQMQWVEQGANIVIHSSDMALFGQRLREDMDKIRKATGERPAGRDKDDPVI